MMIKEEISGKIGLTLRVQTTAGGYHHGELVQVEDNYLLLKSIPKKHSKTDPFITYVCWDHIAAITL